MHPAQGIDREAFICALQQAYGFDLRRLDFLQRGWGGDCYLAGTRGGTRYFLKLFDPGNNQGTAASSRAFYLPLMDQLYTQGILPHVPHPVKTRDGALSLEIGSQVLVVTNFIEGQDIGFGRLPETILAQLAEQVAILHGCRSRLSFEHPLVETFETAFVPDLVQSLADLARVTTHDREALQQLGEILLPQNDWLNEHLERLRVAQQVARVLAPPMVICHTDLHGGNLMTGAGGEPYLLDWENAMIAPREHDMIFFAAEDRDWQIFWPIYRAHFDQICLDPDLLRFYYYRRGLEDVAGFVFRIMAGEGDEAQDQSDLGWLVETLDGLDFIEGIVSRFSSRGDPATSLLPGHQELSNLAG